MVVGMTTLVSLCYNSLLHFLPSSLLITLQSLRIIYLSLRLHNNAIILTVGKCECNSEAVAVAQAIAPIVIEGLVVLGDALCEGVGIALAVVKEVAETTVDIGLTLIPGAGEVNALKVAVKAAKSFAENAMDGKNFAEDYISKCKNSHITDDAKQAYPRLISMDDKYGTSIGCQRKNKKECKKAPFKA